MVASTKKSNQNPLEIKKCEIYISSILEHF
jgi:hypothetical protein